MSRASMHPCLDIKFQRFLGPEQKLEHCSCLIQLPASNWFDPRAVEDTANFNLVFAPEVVDGGWIVWVKKGWSCVWENLRALALAGEAPQVLLKRLGYRDSNEQGRMVTVDAFKEDPSAGDAGGFGKGDVWGGFEA
ncbi:hypothetical protein FRC09_018863 [Ceratobasidium sp. 395]|nr:hypothetical protein FRC09_018863 [Ceratobasidium sp. 395]